MKIIHFSDTHLGFSEYSKVDPQSGLNQREQDFYDAWQQVIDRILADKPDAVVHAGDLFHTPRPSNRAIRIALAGIQAISQAGIPVVIVAGNHETPRIRTTGSIFESIALFPNVFPVFENRYERHRIQDADFHCIPHCSLQEEFETALQSIDIKPDAKFNVLISHGAWSGKDFFGMGEFNELRLPDIEGMTGRHFHYIALGHYHRHVQVAPHAMYSSSTERTSLNEHNAECGFLRVDLKTAETEYSTVHTRAMLKIPPIDCSGLSSAQIYEKLHLAADTKIKNAIVQLTLTNIDNDAFIKLDVREIDRIFAAAFYLEKQLFRQADKTNKAAHTTKIESLPVEFERYLGNLAEGEFDKKALVELGARYLQTES